MNQQQIETVAVPRVVLRGGRQVWSSCRLLGMVGSLFLFLVAVQGYANVGEYGVDRATLFLPTERRMSAQPVVKVSHVPCSMCASSGTNQLLGLLNHLGALHVQGFLPVDNAGGSNVFSFHSCISKDLDGYMAVGSEGRIAFGLGGYIFTVVGIVSWSSGTFLKTGLLVQ